MKSNERIMTIFFIFVVAFFLISAPQKVRAHCDTLDGPVVIDAKKALENGDVTRVLKWVKKDQEAEILAAFQKTLEVRIKGPKAKELADMYFFETLVRIHRAGEGAPYTGLKHAGFDLGPALSAADKAIESGNIEPVIKLLTDQIHHGVNERFKHVMTKKNFNKDDVVAGRKYVEAYVMFMHYVEGIYESAHKTAHNQHEEPVATDKESHH